jgi:hypothetical protein
MKNELFDKAGIANQRMASMKTTNVVKKNPFTEYTRFLQLRGRIHRK